MLSLIKKKGLFIVLFICIATTLLHSLAGLLHSEVPLWLRFWSLSNFTILPHLLGWSRINLHLVILCSIMIAYIIVVRVNSPFI